MLLEAEAFESNLSIKCWRILCFKILAILIGRFLLKQLLKASAKNFLLGLGKPGDTGFGRKADPASSHSLIWMYTKNSKFPPQDFP